MLSCYAFFVKTGKKKEDKLAEAYYHGIKDTKENKFEFLLTHDLENVKFQKLTPKKPKYLFVPFKVDNECENEERFLKLRS